jgi:hypothetical protein
MTEPQYRFAFNRGGLLVDVLRLTEESRDVFKCPACGGDMIPVLPTQGIVKHFRHKNAGECSRESYLHHAAKKAFVQSFLYHARHGGYYVQGKDKLCISDVFDRAYLEEADDGGSRPDITLTSRHDNRKLFIEIYVTHRVDWHTALMRYYPTIEIPIKTEGDIEALRADTLSLAAEGVLLYENGLDIVHFLSNPHYLTAHQFAYIERYGWARLENPDTSKPSTLCALLELGALDKRGRPDTQRLAAIKAAYAERAK